MKIISLKIGGLVSLGLITLGIILFFGYRMYNKPHVDVEKEKAELVIRADLLIEDFENNENQANAKYVDKILQLEGTVSRISFETGNGFVTLKGQNDVSGVLCQMMPEENKNILKYKVGNKVIIKGICTGYLIDVTMVRCVFVD